jgi:hypothetical protein
VKVAALAVDDHHRGNGFDLECIECFRAELFVGDD